MLCLCEKFTRLECVVNDRSKRRTQRLWSTSYVLDISLRYLTRVLFEISALQTEVCLGPSSFKAKARTVPRLVFVKIMNSLSFTDDSTTDAV
jgi:hypothetical protein